MRKGYKVTLGILTIMIMITLTIGTSYSYYMVSEEQTNPNTLTSACFNIEWTQSNTISLNSDGSYAYPMSEANALAKYTPYTFTIRNTCTTANSSLPIKYDITLNTLVSKTSNLTNYLRYKLNQTSPAGDATASKMINTTTYPMSAEMKTKYGINDSYSLLSGTLNAGEAKTFELYLWIDENAPQTIMGETFAGKVLIYSYV